MTAKATAAPPTAARKAKPRRTSESTQRNASEEADLRRYTPEEVIEYRWLPYKSARVLREKAYKHEVHCHKDGGVITFTAEDIRQENARHAVAPIDLTKRVRSAA
ncbi:hypothetical protein [Streptomyces flavidovirens]|uniref:hypothetical protein n=1 Tax=Streptomyces flavidovirens TaxID=67298 RepID=UPI00368FA73F